MFATGVTVGLAEWIINDSCLVFIYLQDELLFLFAKLPFSIDISGVGLDSKWNFATEIFMYFNLEQSRVFQG